MTELQISVCVCAGGGGGVLSEDNAKIIFLNENICLTTHQNRLDETILMVGHKLCFFMEKTG